MNLFLPADLGRALVVDATLLYLCHNYDFEALEILQRRVFHL